MNNNLLKEFLWQISSEFEHILVNSITQNEREGEKILTKCDLTAEKIIAEYIFFLNLTTIFFSLNK